MTTMPLIRPPSTERVARLYQVTLADHAGRYRPLPDSLTPFRRIALGAAPMLTNTSNAYRIASHIARSARVFSSLADNLKRIPSVCDQLGIKRRDPRRRLVRELLPHAWRLTHPPMTVGITDPTLQQRLAMHLVAKACSTVHDLPADGDRGQYRLTDYDRAQRVWSCRAEYWYEYSRRHGRRLIRAGIVAGYEDGQLWARRVPYDDAASVADAIAYLQPAAVKAALAEGREVRRQGDIWFVPLKRGRSNLDEIRGSDHAAMDQDGRLVVVHPQHGTLDLGEGAWHAYSSRDSARPGVQLSD